MNGRAGYALLTGVSWVFDAGLLAGVEGGYVAIQDLTLCAPIKLAAGSPW